MKPLPAVLTLEHSVAAAREFMDAFGIPYLVVVAPSTGRMLGVVVDEALARTCEGEDHDPDDCPLVRHVETDIDFCLDSEKIDEVFGDGPDKIPYAGAERGDSAHRADLPVIVVDEFKVPVGYLERPKA